MCILQNTVLAEDLNANLYHKHLMIQLNLESARNSIRENQLIEIQQLKPELFRFLAIM